MKGESMNADPGLSGVRGRRLGLWGGLAITGALLAGCAQPVSSPAATRPKALVYGAVSSPVFDALRSTLDVTMGDATADASAFDLVVLDGDNFTGQQIAHDGFISRAIHSGVWVLGVDMAEDDKKEGVMAQTACATPNASRYYMVQQSRRKDASLVYTFVDPGNAPNNAEQDAQRIASLANTGVVGDPDDPTAPLPTGLLNLTCRVVTPGNPTFLLPANKNPVFPRNAQQQASWTVTHSLRLFLDNGNNPQGDFQHLLVTTWGNANPGVPISNTRDDCNGDGRTDECETAWIQTRFDTSTQVPDGSGLRLLEAVPQNVNNQTTITTGSTFSIGFSEDSGPSASYSYSSSSTKTITDWQALNNSSADLASWTYASDAPLYNGLVTSGYDGSMWYYYGGGVAPSGFNTLSSSNFQYVTAAHYTTSTLKTGVVRISGEDKGYYNDTWVVRGDHDDNPSGNNWYCVWFLCGSDPNQPGTSDQEWNQHYSVYINDQPWALDVNMAAVIPVQPQSLKFKDSPVPAGQSTVATLALQSPTFVDLKVNVGSTTPGIAPDKTNYTIPAGSDHFDFPINTTSACRNEPATITVSSIYFAAGQNGVLSCQ